MPDPHAPDTVPNRHDPVIARLRAVRPDVEPTAAALLADRGPAILTRVLDSPRQTASVGPRAEGGHRPLGRRLALTGAMVVVGAGAAGLLVGDPTAPAAFATWTAVPQTAPGSTPSHGDVEAWASQCTDLTGYSVSIGGVSARDAEAVGRSVLVDRRGGYTFCVDVAAGDGTEADPLTATASLEGDDVEGGWATVYDEPVALPRGGDVLVLGGDLQEPPPGDGDPDVDHGDDFFLVYGMAGEDVTGVELALPSGLSITTTIHEGLWGAWWPAAKGAATDSTLLVRTGSDVQRVDPDAVGLDWEE